MDALLTFVAGVIIGLIGLCYWGHRRAVATMAVKNSRSQARRWVERLGGQGLDPGPELPALPGQLQAGAVTQDRSVTVEGRQYLASPDAGDRTRHHHPGGTVASRPVPRGWYSDPWWQSAFDTGSAAVSSYLIASSLLYGMAGYGWDANFAASLAAEAKADDSGHEGVADYAGASPGDAPGAGV